MQIKNLHFFNQEKKLVRLIIQLAPVSNSYEIPYLILELSDNLHMLWIRNNYLFN